MTLTKRMGGSSYEQFRKSNPAQHSQRLTEVRAEYDAEQLRVPCMSLQCIGYNVALVDALSNRGSNDSPAAGPSSSSSSGAALRSSKRRRLASILEDSSVTEDSDDDRPLRRVRVSRAV